MRCSKNIYLNSQIFIFIFLTINLTNLTITHADTILQNDESLADNDKKYCDTAHKKFLDYSSQKQIKFLNEMLFGSSDETSFLDTNSTNEIMEAFTFREPGIDCSKYTRGIIGQFCYLLFDLNKRKIHFTKAADLHSQHSMFGQLVNLESELPKKINMIAKYNCYADSINRSDLRVDFYDNLDDIPKFAKKNLTANIIASAYLNEYSAYIEKISQTISINNIPPKHAKDIFLALAERIERGTGIGISCETEGTVKELTPNNQSPLIIGPQHQIKGDPRTEANAATEYPKTNPISIPNSNLSSSSDNKAKHIVKIPDYIKCIFSARQIMSALSFTDFNIAAIDHRFRYFRISEYTSSQADYDNMITQAEAELILAKLKLVELKQKTESKPEDITKALELVNDLKNKKGHLTLSWRNDASEIIQKFGWLKTYDPSPEIYQKMRSLEQDVRARITALNKYETRFAIDFNYACILDEERHKKCTETLIKLDKLLDVKDSYNRSLILDHPAFFKYFKIRINLADEYTDWVSSNIFQIGSHPKDTLEYIVSSLKRGTMVGRVQKAETPTYNNLGALPSPEELRKMITRNIEKRRAALLEAQAALLNGAKPTPTNPAEKKLSPENRNNKIAPPIASNKAAPPLLTNFNPTGTTQSPTPSITKHAPSLQQTTTQSSPVNEKKSEAPEASKNQQKPEESSTSWRPLYPRQ